MMKWSSCEPCAGESVGLKMLSERALNLLEIRINADHFLHEPKI
jgi:hypothetical protein